MILGIIFNDSSYRSRLYHKAKTVYTLHLNPKPQVYNSDVCFHK